MSKRVSGAAVTVTAVTITLITSTYIDLALIADLHTTTEFTSAQKLADAYRRHLIPLLPVGCTTISVLSMVVTTVVSV